MGRQEGELPYRASEEVRVGRAVFRAVARATGVRGTAGVPQTTPVAMDKALWDNRAHLRPGVG
eukprot:10267854-Alexandrium_andersonii.AAC.1